MIKHGLNGLHFNERRSDSVAVHNCDTRRWWVAPQATSQRRSLSIPKAQSEGKWENMEGSEALFPPPAPPDKNITGGVVGLRLNAC
jgi:hypothetical protein